MNEVRLGQAALQAVIGSSSSKGAADAKEQPPSQAASAAQAVQDKANEAEQAKPASELDLKQEVARVNDYVQNVQRDLQFSVDEELDRTIIRVVDSDSGELIRQIPEDIFLELARRLEQDGEMHLLNALG
ncbi:flagellar protein FlaG [Agaribacterium haliotis]|uniref:flagellar protein FlaG n=1 Tax=Agaribacterium haliotis TaxID=2013869 RepID=UPI000BB54160|nr:flagellar protein FlaG [Agaribacterium haliotis]